MSKRFFDTGLVEQRWYMNLAPKHKALYIHCLSICDCVGVFDVNERLFTAYIGDDIKGDDVFNVFGNRCVPFSDDKALLVDFVYFQCGGEIRESCPAHFAILKNMKKYGLSVERLQELCTHELKYTKKEFKKDVVSIDDANSNSDSIDTERKEKEKDKKSAKDNSEFESMFERFWTEYPNKASKKKAHDKFISMMNRMSNTNRTETFNKIMKSLSDHKKTEQWMKESGRFIPMAITWLNGERYNDVLNGVDEDCNVSKIENIISTNILSKIKLS